MRGLDLFKIRKGETRQVMDAATKAFGTPVEVEENLGVSRRMRWRFYDEFLYLYGFEVGFRADSDVLDITIEIETNADDKTICGPVLRGNAQSRIEGFIKEVRKPWEEWDESEIMQGAMWVYMYKRDGNQPTKAMESMMAMLSFQSPEDEWVKRYFKEGRG